MAQFKKHLFGTSYFGYSNTFEGVYTTSIIDAEEPFTGAIDYRIKASLPLTTYLGKETEWGRNPAQNSWVVSGNMIKTSSLGDSISFILSADLIKISFTSLVNYGIASIEVMEVQSKKIISSETIDTSANGIYSKSMAYGLYQVTIKNTDGKPLELLKMDARVVSFQVEVQTSLDGKVWSGFNKVTLTETGTKDIWTGKSAIVTNQKFVQSRFHLITSDINSTPFIDTIDVSSGDISKYAMDGYWYCAVDFEQVAAEQNVTFSKVKRVEWKETSQPQTTATIRSTSKAQGMPTTSDLSTSTYWPEETAPYTVNRDTSNLYGIPYSRLALAESSTFSSITFQQLTPENYGLQNSKNQNWKFWSDQSFYPYNSAGTDLYYEFYVNKMDLIEGVPPLFTIKNAPRNTNKMFAIPEKYKNHSFFVRIVLAREKTKQTPVVDYLDCYANMQYSNTRKAQETPLKLTPVLENQTTINQSDVSVSQFNWPSNTQILPINVQYLKGSTRHLTIQYNPKYPGQMELYFESKKAALNDRNHVSFSANDSTFKDILRATSVADEPVASTLKIKGNRLVYHYAYDGATVKFPVPTKVELPMNYTPDLLPSKKYAFKLIGGWPNQTQIVPFSMTWKELAELITENETSLKSANKDIKLYNGKLPQGVSVTLPNTSKNTKVVLSYSSGPGWITRNSTWNGLSNDQIVGNIPSINGYSYTDWTSEEKIFTGYVNDNDKNHPYIRTQKVSYGNDFESTYTVQSGETYTSIAKKFNVDPFDLERTNTSKNLTAGIKIKIQPSFTLPEINPEVIFDNINPYKVEIIPYTTKRKDGELLSNDTVTLGSDDEQALAYTYKKSEVIKVTMIRGKETNGRDPLPFANVSNITNITSLDGTVKYTPYSKAVSTGSEIGDYELKDNYIYWTSKHSLSKEPAANDSYIVYLQYQTVDTVKIVMTSEYKEMVGYDKLWRSEDILIMDGIVTPTSDFKKALPAKETFSGYNPLIKDVEYVVEDDDLWVQTKVVKEGNTSYLYASMNGENPKRNWYPEINTGYYYLDDQEYYMYSEPITTTYGDTEIPIVSDVLYQQDGLKLQIAATNYITNSTLDVLDDTYEQVF